MKYFALLLGLVAGVGVPFHRAEGATLRVGPGQTFKSPCEAIRAAAAGDTIEIEAAGSYDGDVCVVDKPNLTIRGVGNGRPHIRAAGRSAEGKGIWVVRGAASPIVVENIEFSGVEVRDKNGVGIRVENGASATVRNCHFHDSDQGILVGNSLDAEIVVENSIFENLGAGDGLSHSIYVNHVKRFIFRGNYSARAKAGQLVKSRAAETYILYNRLTQESGTGSREIDISNGGLAVIVGNYVQQGDTSVNGNLIGYMAEGPHASNPSRELYVVNNTIVNERRAGAQFIFVHASVQQPAIVRNNIFAGTGQLITQASAVMEGNFIGQPGFAAAASFDYRLDAGSPAVNAGVPPGQAGTFDLTPLEIYMHPACTASRAAVGGIDAGAYEFGWEGEFEKGPERCRAGGPAPVIQAAVNGASSVEKLAAGSITTIYGRNLAAGEAHASETPLPMSLGEVTVLVSGIPAPLFYVSPSQVNFQVPYGLASGPHILELRLRDRGTATAAVTLMASAPGIFLYNGNRAVAQNQDFSLNTRERGARPGEAIIVYLTGSGPLSRFLKEGVTSPGDDLALATLPATARIGGKDAQVAFLGMTPGLVGVLQSNLIVPDLTPGEHAVTLTIGDQTSNEGMITVSGA